MPLWRRWWFRILSLVLLAVGGLAVKVYWERRDAAEELRQVLADLDKSDPDWRLEQIEAKRRVIGDDENGALIVMKANRELPKDWQSKVRDEIGKLPPPAELPNELATRLRNELKPLEGAIIESRRMIHYSWGRFPITYSPEWINTIAPDQEARNVAALLQLDACALLQNRQEAKAWASIHALLNTSRSLGDQPLFISALVRWEIHRQAVQSIERALAQGTMSAASLMGMQQAIVDEADEPLLVTAMLGERAGVHQCFAYLESGSFSPTANLEGLTQGWRRREAGWYEYLNDIVAMKMVYRSHAWLVRHYTKIIEAAKKPDYSKYQALEDIHESALDFHAMRNGAGDKDYSLANIFWRGIVKLGATEQRAESHLHCAIAALAAERFRLKHNRWPASLDELVQAKLLKEAPEDLYDGNPIRLRCAANGIVFYSVGPVKNYQGDALDRLEDFNPNRIRIEFRLWDPAQRRQPPLPPRKPEDLP